VSAVQQPTTAPQSAAVTWKRVARRIRVPLGFCFAAVYLWLAEPTWPWMAVGAVLVAAGLALRASASGHVRKNSELTTTGPYRYTRNPLYLGSLMVGCGFAVAARSWWVALSVAVLFAAIYWPVILAEEEFLRAQFAGFDDYARRVPRLFPAVRPRGEGGSFSRALYRQHREYNALIGSLLLMLALVAKMWWRISGR
jgi:protein-S-isoprenylcysteine O-methyltransferase Ste14